MRLKLLFNKQRGDTIIEVLLAMSIIGLVLGSSYAIANRSLAIGRTAQERTEALKQAETQLERLRALSTYTTPNPLVSVSNTKAFCIDSKIELIEFSADPVDLPDITTTTKITDVDYPDGVDECETGPASRYHVAIKKSPSPDDYLFKVNVRWERLGGGLLEELEIEYRIYPKGAVNSSPESAYS